MSDGGSKQERAPRFTVDWCVSLRCPTWGAARQVVAANISRGGVFIRTPEPPAVGARVHVGIELPDGTFLRLGGECVHVRDAAQAGPGRHPGCGVRIDAKHAPDLERIAALAQAAEARRP